MSGPANDRPTRRNARSQTIGKRTPKRTRLAPGGLYITPGFCLPRSQRGYSQSHEVRKWQNPLPMADIYTDEKPIIPGEYVRRRYTMLLTQKEMLSLTLPDHETYRS